MLSFYLKGGLEESVKFFQELKIITLAVSFGGFESVARLPSKVSIEINYHYHLVTRSLFTCSNTVMIKNLWASILLILKPVSGRNSSLEIGILLDGVSLNYRIRILEEEKSTWVNKNV